MSGQSERTALGQYSPRVKKISPKWLFLKAINRFLINFFLTYSHKFFFLCSCQPQFTGGSDEVEVCAMRNSDAVLNLYLITHIRLIS